MKTLIISDVHTHYAKAERICQKFKDTHKFIFLGDYFDQFNDTPEINLSTAEWLKHSLEDSNRIHLRGNHDEHYDPRVNLFCSGFSIEKKNAINSLLTIEDWDKLKYFHFENDWWFSHAGLTNYWFSEPMTGDIVESYVQKVIDNAIVKQRMGKPVNAIWAADAYRGGSEAVGSLLWADWRGLLLIEGVKQVVGHTPLRNIEMIFDMKYESTNINVDNSGSGVYHSECLEINESGHPNIINTSYI